MSLRKEQYERIAKILKNYADDFNQLDKTSVMPKELIELQRNVLNNIGEDLADYFAEDNLLFNRTRFLKACGVE